MGQHLRLRVIGSLLTLVYIIMIFTSTGKGFRDSLIIIAIILFFVSGFIEMRKKNEKYKNIK